MLLNRLPLIIAICLSILIGGALYWQLEPIIRPYIFSDKLSNNTKLTNSLTQSTMPDQSTSSIKHEHNIASFKLFGDALAPNKKAPIETEKLPETTLRLKLTGVLAGKNDVLASALIEGPDRQTRNYRIDEDVPGGATIKHVYYDRVVLERAGRLENLIFEETRPIGIVTQAAIQEPEPIAAPTPNFNPNSNIQNFNQQQTQQIKDRLSRLRTRLQNNAP